MTDSRLGHSHRAAALLAKVEALLPDMLTHAPALDANSAFPTEDIASLREAGLLAAPVPERLGGLGAGTEPGGAKLALSLLRQLGRGNLAIARLFEAHLNVLRLVFQSGTPEQCTMVAGDALAGQMFGLWVTDPPRTQPLHVAGTRLTGEKGPASGAGHCRRALVTVATADGTRMMLIALAGTEAVRAMEGLHGMRAAANGTIALNQAEILFWLGAPGEYLREPDFSCGAWRGSAAASGALDALIDAVASDLRRKGHAEAPIQLARFGEMLIAQQTARFWTEHAASLAEADHGDPAAQVAAVNLSRIAVETACLDSLRLAHRSLGLAAFVAPHPVERISRDLSTYLRQPATDDVLLEAAAYGLRRC